MDNEEIIARALVDIANSLHAKRIFSFGNKISKNDFEQVKAEITSWKLDYDEMAGVSIDKDEH